MVLDAQGLAEEQLGGFLRQRGLHEATLCDWRETVLRGAKAELGGRSDKQPGSAGSPRVAATIFAAVRRARRATNSLQPRSNRCSPSPTRPNSTMCHRGRASRRSPTATRTTPPNRPSTASCEGTACLHHRAHSRPPTSRPRALTATGPDQVYSWDITYLRSRVRGVYFYLYLVVDIWSRRIVGWAIHDIESGELAAALVERICAGNQKRDNVLWLHSDNGAAMKSVPLLAKLKVLGVSPSFSRPRVSNDNPYS